jgi:hypothetical protein
MDKPLVVGSQSFYFSQFIHEGIDNALKNMVDKGGVNTLLLASHIDFQSTKTWGPLPNSTDENYDCDGFNCDPCPEFYETTQIKPVKTKIPILNERDLFREITEACKKFDIEVYSLILHRFPDVDRYPGLNMKTVNGQSVPKTLCHNQPDVINFYDSLIDHLDAKYELDGYCFALLDHYSLFGFQSLTDELADTLGIASFSNPEMGLSCFCAVCIVEAEAKGIDVGKVKKGLLKGIELGFIPHKVEKMKSADEAIRFLLSVPEYLDWLRFRSTIMTRLHKRLYERIKSKKRSYKVGLDIYGAKDDWKYQTQFSELSKYCDWIKPMFYSCTYDEPLSPEEIGEGVKLAMELSGKPIYPGINCLPTESEEKIRRGVQCAMENGAEGVILSWDYCLTPYKNMLAAKNELFKS